MKKHKWLSVGGLGPGKHQRTDVVSASGGPVASSSSLFPCQITGVHHFGWDFCVCDRFFNPSIEVVTFCLHGWCMLGVFLLPAFTRLGHERQDLLSLCNGMHVCTDLSLYSHPKEFGGNGVRTHFNSKRKILSTGKNCPQRRIEPKTLHQAGQWAQHTTNELYQPLDM